MQRGQYYAVMKLLQAAVFAAVLLLIAWGITQAIEEYLVGTDVFSISVEVLKSAYNSRGIDKPFVRRARLINQGFTEESLHSKTGIPEDVEIKIFCNKSFCKPVCRYYITSNNNWGNGCEDITLKSGSEINVCAYCNTTSTGVPKVKCGVFLDEDACNIYIS